MPRLYHRVPSIVIVLMAVIRLEMRQFDLHLRLSTTSFSPSERPISQ